ncbi:MAG: sulfate transporter family protein [Rhodothalassiaceae bacterium]
MSLFSALGQAFAQLDDPRFRRVILLGFLWSMAIFVLLFAGLASIVPMIPESGIAWLDQSIAWTLGLSAPFLFLLLIWLLFPAIMTLVTSLFLDDIIDAVEDRHYPHDRSGRRSSPVEAVFLALRMSLLVALTNIVALPAYILLLVTGFGAPLLYLVLNGWLLGREYFEMVAVRHAGLREAAAMRRASGSAPFMGGLMIAALFMVPIVGLIAPVVGCALMTHRFHAAKLSGGIAG